MRRRIVIGNWKMNGTTFFAKKLASDIKESGVGLGSAEVVLCPPFTLLSAVSEVLEKSALKIGAQDLFWEEKGSYTGEVSASMIKEFGDFVIVGHSERRQNQGETDEQINKKVLAAVNAGLVAVLCIGESKQDYQAKNFDAVIDQLITGLAGVTAEHGPRIIIAYEPIWAIGAAEPATPQHANFIAARIRQELGGILTRSLASDIRILYGGSVTHLDAAKFVAEEEVDGLLVGRVSLDPDDFCDIVKNVNKVR